MLPGGNIGLLTTRQTSDNWDVLATRVIAGHKSLAAYDINSLFPLYLSPAAEGEKSGQKSFLDTQLGSGPGGRRPNLNPKFTADVVGRLGLSFVADGTGDLQKTLGPEDIFHYLYAVLHSPTYRSRYAEFLKIDFPRVPLTSDLSLFRNLVAKGEDLVALHLIESPLLSAHLPRYPVKGDNRVENGYPRYLDSGGRVYISKDQYFEDVPPEVWSFHIGGYQVCEKWLKDRRGRPLSYDDLSHYQKIIVALKETIRLMTEIDQLIPSWPLM